MRELSRLALLGTLAVLGIGQAVSPAAADTLGVDITGSFNTFDAGGDSVGYQFTVGSQPVLLTALGVFDDGSISNLNLDAGSTNIGFYAVNDPTALQTVSITTANEASIEQIGLWAFIPITPILLTPTDTYVVAAETEGPDTTDGLEANPDQFVINPYISDLTAVEDDTAPGTLTYPGTSISELDPGYFGANVELVPEPMSLSLFGVGLAGLGLLRRRQRA